MSNERKSTFEYGSTCCLNMGLNLKIVKMPPPPPELFAKRYMDNVADQTDHYTNVDVLEHISYSFDGITLEK